MRAWLSTINPNRHTFSLLHFQCSSHYSEYHGSDVGLCLNFSPEPVILWANFRGLCGARGAWPPFLTACSSSCSCSHTFKECKQFKGKKQKDKILLLSEKGVCLACVYVVHMSRDCERHLTCQVCCQIHPAVLYIKRQSTAQDPSEGNHLISRLFNSQHLDIEELVGNGTYYPSFL